MPWTALSGNTYSLCLLDTNALSEIIKYPKIEGRGFVEKYGPSDYAPCITVYNLIELRRSPELFKAYIDFFSKYPSFLLKPYNLIITDERNLQSGRESVTALMHAFTPFGPNQSYDLQRFVEKFFSLPEIASLERVWRDEENDILQSWLSNKGNFQPTQQAPNARDAERYIQEAGLQTLINLDPKWVEGELNTGHIPNIANCPSLKVMLYSQYYRIFDPNWKPRPQEVTDICIVAAAPYVDVVITERFQAGLLRRIRGRVAGMENLEIATLRDIRYKEN